MAYSAVLLTILLVASSLAQNPCDYYQTLAIGQMYYIYNPGYPQPFQPNTKCRWISYVAVGYKIQLDCTDINIMQSTNCASDRMSVSLTGDPNFLDGQNYCGSGTQSLTSTTTSMSVGLYSLNNSPGGKISCQIQAIPDASSSTTTNQPNTCDCGWRQQRRIVGGTETGINEYPFTAALINTNEKKLFCGATIVHYHYAITAAHCLIKINNINIHALLVGDHDYTIGETNSAAFYPLSEFKYHENYNSVSQENDIGIVRTQNDMTFSMAVGPVCLPFRWSDATPSVGSTVTVLGWGTTEFTGPQSIVLLGANLSTVSNPYCQAEYAGHSQIFQTQLCTYAYGKDACQSDSGGPVVYLDNNSRRLYLAAVVSYGIGCAMDYPGVNTRTTSFMSWIITNTQDASYCIK